MSQHLLLVDDNAIQGTTRRMVLERSGFSVTLADNGARALDYFPLGPAAAPFSLVITDHIMPEMNGPELVRELRTRGIDLPVIVLSGLPDAESLYDGLNVLFRLKPLAPDALIALARECSQGPPMARTA